MNQKIFPIKTATACQLKWSHSTVFLTRLATSSCHRVKHNTFDIDAFDFHNIPEKISARKLMLEGKWPGNGCEHCKSIEDAGGTSDRIIHLDMPGYEPPPELDSDPVAVSVTPRQLEIYFSNVCNLKCLYCIPEFSSQINQENSKFGPFNSNGINLPGFKPIPEEYKPATDKMFEWLDKNIHYLHKLMILGGEPFVQKETKRLLNFLTGRKLPDLDLVIFSNLTIDHDVFKEYIDQLKLIKNDCLLKNIQIIGSLDCWGEPAEYVRSGLNLNMFQRNFEYVLNNTDFLLNINSALGPLTAPTMPALAKKINEWSKTRTVYWSMMKTGGWPFMHPAIFGPVILDLGYREAIKLFDTNDCDIKKNYKTYYNGIIKEIEQSVPDLNKQLALKTYLVEMDRRRGTDYKKTFPSIAALLEDVKI